MGLSKKLTASLVHKKLLDFGLFPEKIENVFSSEKFGRWVRKTGYSKYKDRHFSHISFKLTRSNNAPRILNIPHPIAYIRLCNEIKTNWKNFFDKIGEVADYQKRSMIIPKPNNLNERLVSMLSYNKNKKEKFITLEKQTSKKYYVHADISNFYPNIYSHSIAWALVGKETAKKNQKDDTLWYNKIDFAVRGQQRNETIGIAIGPDTSGIIAELILSQVDKDLEHYSYTRYIDDYNCFCESKDKAEQFLRDLSRSLEKYNLRLNAKKTKIVELPTELDDDWVRQLRDFSNAHLGNAKKEITSGDLTKVSDFLDLAISLNEKNPEEATIRYAAQILTKKKYASKKVFAFVIIYLSRICFIHPYFIDLFHKLLRVNKKLIDKKLLSLIEDEINSIINEQVKNSLSDVSLWAVYLAKEYNFEIKDFESISNSIISSRDCMPTLICYLYAKKKKLPLKKYLDLVADLMDEQLEDEWWIYIYEVFRDNSTKPAFKKISYKDFYKELVTAKITFIA